MDGGATCHVKISAKHCINLRQVDIELKVGGGKVRCTQLGDLPITVPLPQNRQGNITLKDVRIVPNFGINIISEPLFMRKKCTITKTDKHTDIDNYKGQPVLRAAADPASGLHFVKVAPLDPSVNTTATTRIVASTNDCSTGTEPHHEQQLKISGKSSQSGCKIDDPDLLPLISTDSADLNNFAAACPDCYRVDSQYALVLSVRVLGHKSDITRL